MAIKFEVLTEAGKSKRGRFFVRTLLDALAKTNRQFIASKEITGDADCLILWGVGGSIQQEAYWKYRNAGKPVVMADIGYFGRSKHYRISAFRVSFNDYHPERYVGHVDSTRFDKEGVKLRNTYLSTGHILLCGLGNKSRKLYGYHNMSWEQKTFKRLKELYPGVDIYYRHKPKQSETLSGTIDCNGGDITQALNRCRLCVVHHSNVAVDCAVAGVPCVSMYGIGSAFWPDDLDVIYKPSEEIRKEFLNQVAWWNWYPSEMDKMLDFLEPKILEYMQTNEDF